MKYTVLLLLTLLMFNIGSANSFNRPLPLGSIEGVYPEYNDADTINIPVGYGECNGAYWELTSSTTLDVTDPNADDFIYIYIDYSASSFPTPSFTESTDEPAWSDSKMGWYRQSTGNEEDRCIGAVYWDDSETEIYVFKSYNNIVFYDDNIWLLTSGSSTSYVATSTDSDTVTPVFAYAQRIKLNMDEETNDNCGAGFYSIAMGPGSAHQVAKYSSVIRFGDWVTTGTSDRTLYYKRTHGTVTVSMILKGYKFER